jgi:WD40 repeat protein
MRASTVDWIQHGNMPINSVDVQPKGFRILTGGNDNKVCIWNLLPIVNREYEVKGMDQYNTTNSKEAGGKTEKQEESKIEIEIDAQSAMVGSLFNLC